MHKKKYAHLFRQYSDIIHKNNPYFIGYYSIFFKRVDEKSGFL